MNDLSGTCKHGTSRAKPCGECMAEGVAEIAKHITAEPVYTDPRMLGVEEPTYTLKQSVEMIMEHEDLHLFVTKVGYKPHSVSDVNAYIVSMLTPQ